MKAPRDVATTAHRVTSLKNRIMTNAIRTSDLVQFRFIFNMREREGKRERERHTLHGVPIRHNTDCTELSYSVTVQPITAVSPALRQCLGNSQISNTQTSQLV
jgi:hypothetical protein